jgi:hypothetical protein
MNNEWVEITKKQNKIFVRVKLPIFDRFESVGKIKVTRGMVERYLISKKITFDKCIEGPSILRNTLKGSHLATWIFECAKKTKRSRPHKRTKSPVELSGQEKNIEKTLDKTPESVIIEVEEKQSSQKEE